MIAIASIDSAFASRAIAIFLLALGLGHGLEDTTDTAQTRQENATVFEEITAIIEKHFFDSDRLDQSWQRKVNDCKKRIEKTSSSMELEKEVNLLLAQLKVSHTKFYSKDNPKRYQLLGVFHKLYNDENDQLFVYPGIGLSGTRRGGKFIVDAVFDGFPAAQSGIRFGDVIESVGGKKFSPINSFSERVDQVVELQVLRGSRRVKVLCNVVPLDGRTMFESALKNSSRVIERNGKRIGYLHVWSFAGAQFQEIIKSQILWGPLANCDALVLDLRDGWGGADINYLNLFRKPIASITSTMADGRNLNLSGTWNRPVALLINERTTSGKELFSYGFKKLQLGPVVGTPTAGAVLAGRCFLLSNGDVLYLAVAGVEVDGKALEGIGVEPTLRIERDASLQRDNQLERTLEVLFHEIGRNAKESP